MCVVSMMYDSVRTVPIESWTRPAFNDFQIILDSIKELDRKLNQKDCEDPSKALWMKLIEDRLKKLEGG